MFNKHHQSMVSDHDQITAITELGFPHEKATALFYAMKQSTPIDSDIPFNQLKSYAKSLLELSLYPCPTSHVVSSYQIAGHKLADALVHYDRDADTALHLYFNYLYDNILGIKRLRRTVDDYKKRVDIW